jgi:hypothetical protein
MEINRYRQNLNRFIEEAKSSISLDHLFGPHKRNTIAPTAKWSDKAWVYPRENDKTLNMYFHKPTKRLPAVGTISSFRGLPSTVDEIVKIYALHMLNKSVSTNYIINHIRVVKLVLLNSSLLESYASNAVTQWIDNSKKIQNESILITKYFLQWMKKNKLIPSTIEEPTRPQPGFYSEDTEKRRSDKLPDEKVIIALGAITHDVIPWNKNKWNTKPLDNQRDAFVCAMSALALSSPNRVAAEQTILNRQDLKSIKQIINGEEQEVFYLDWKGSKGFDDNKNHILSSMAPVVRHHLEYLKLVTKPNRIIARFYKNPNAPLKDILAGYAPANELTEKHNFDLSKPINLFTLGALLGFYDDTELGAKVVEGTKRAITIERAAGKRGVATDYYKSHAELQENDELIINQITISNLLNVKINGSIPSALGLKKTVTVGELQRIWIKHIFNQFPTFPKLLNNRKNGYCDAEYRLFALSGKQLSVGGAGYTASGSPYAIISPITLSKMFADNTGGKYDASIFKRFGFSKDFKITPHQFRHYLNDLAEKNGVPRIVINMWSGRKDPSQIVHYVHTTDDERSSSVSDILYSDQALSKEKAKKQIKIWSAEEYEVATGQIASITSSGICTQDLMVTPCNYLNDFLTQCTLCSKSCHVAHDKDAIKLLNKDIQFQDARLEEVKTHPSFQTSTSRQKWFKLHFRNTETLKQLIELMNDKNIEEGSLIRVVNGSNEFRITNLKTKKVEIKPLLIPSVDQQLSIELTNKEDTQEDSIINDLLEMF